MIDPLNTTFTELLLHAVREYADRPAVSIGEQTMTYAELAGAVGALQAGLQEMGVAPGDRLAMLFPNTPHFYIAFFAAQACGAEVVLLNCLHSSGELAYVIDDSQAKYVLALDAFNDKLPEALQQCPNVRGVAIAGQVGIDGAASMDGMIAANLGQEITVPERSAEDVAVLMYTSGTTGRSKGAMLTHRNIIFDAAAADTILDVQPDDKMIAVLPLFHAYGFTVNLVLGILTGAETALLPKFAATTAMETIEQKKITVLAAVPTMYQLMLRTKRTPDYDLSSLRVGVSGGAAIPLEVMKQFEERYGVYMLEGYGPTEAAPVVSVNPLHGIRKLGSVGPPLPGIEVQVVDDDDNPLPVGEIGELCVRGPNVMVGYWNNPEATAETIVHGWLHTGDLARLDEDNYIYIVDRKKDMIIVGGMNVYPREVEDVIYELPQIAEVAVVGIPSKVKGEDVIAYVAFKEGESLAPEVIIEHCRQRLAPFKVPRDVVVETELPKAPTGKVLRRQVREAAKERFSA